MTHGEIHGLHKQVVDDLKAQLAAAREDARNERTRAEAAEQELRSERSGEWVEKSHHAKLAIYAGKLQNKLAAIRAHLKGVDVKSEEMIFDGGDPVSPATTRCLLAAAREALEP